MKKTVWVLTKAVNEYNQEGDYLEAVFIDKPTRKDLLLHFFGGSGDNKDYEARSHEHVGHVLKGGGRIEAEYEWFYLGELKSGEKYQHSA